MRFDLKSAALVVSTSLLAPAAMAGSDGDAAKGANTFKRCAGCHRVGASARNATGPVLNDVIGRVAGTFPGFRYSNYMVSAGAGGLIWSEELIAEYIKDPSKFLQTFLGNPSAKAKMRFKLFKEQDRLNVAAYVATFSPI